MYHSHSDKSIKPIMRKHILFLSLLLCLPAAAQDDTRTYTIHNPNGEALTQTEVEISGIEGFRSAAVTIDGKEIPSQMDDLDGDGGADHLFFLTDIPKKGSVQAKVELWRNGKPRQYKARTFADLLLRNYKVKAKNKHDIYFGEFSSLRGTNPYSVIHQHGAVFESELTAFRIYCSPRQTVDIYGKRKRQLELRESEFYPDNEQLAAGYGDDVLVVGDGVGCGALNGWDGSAPVAFTDCDSRTQRIVASGPLRSIVEIVDKNWRPQPDSDPMTLTTRYIMVAGHRDCHVEVSATVPKGFTFTPSMAATRYFTGVTNIKGSQKYSDGKGLLCCWGTDWPLVGDTLKQTRQTVGLAVCVPQDNVEREADTQRDYGIVLTMPSARMDYYLSFCSDKEEQGFHSAKEWFDHIKAWKKRLALKPATVKQTDK